MLLGRQCLYGIVRGVGCSSFYCILLIECLPLIFNPPLVFFQSMYTNPNPNGVLPPPRLFPLQLKMLIIGVDIAVNAFWAFMWFVNFCYTADQRRRTNGDIIERTAIKNCANAGIAFSFFSIILWVSFKTGIKCF